MSVSTMGVLSELQHLSSSNPDDYKVKNLDDDVPSNHQISIKPEDESPKNHPNLNRWPVYPGEPHNPDPSYNPPRSYDYPMSMESGSATTPNNMDPSSGVSNPSISPQMESQMLSGGHPSQQQQPQQQSQTQSPHPLCAGCQLRIVDKYILCATERKWHATCLKCVECGSELESHTSCYEKNGLIFCKDDYYRIYGNGNKRCSRCHTEISSNLVMKAKDCVYHIDCFRCVVCDNILKKGDVFGMTGESLFCKAHYEQLPYMSPPDTRNQDLYFSPHQPQLPPQQFPPHQYGHIPPGGDAWFQPGDYPMGGPGGPGCPGGPGVPGEEFPYDNNNEPKKRRGRKKRKNEAFAAMNGFLDGAYPSGGLQGMDPACSQTKTKRARTSFKHHQLRIMKTHFNINQNPDSRELKSLSQKTGLDKKVLQVWFQNARAKWRRVNGQSGSTGAAPGAINPDSSRNSGIPSVMNNEAMSEENCDSDSMTA